jgi:hypothetical protein
MWDHLPVQSLIDFQRTAGLNDWAIRREGFVSDPTNDRLYGQPCPRHERDPFAPGRCWKCGAKMRLPAMRGNGHINGRTRG